MAEQEVQQALQKLLRATKEFTQAYEAWTHAPRAWEPLRRTELEKAEERLTEAQREVRDREARDHSM